MTDVEETVDRGPELETAFAQGVERGAQIERDRIAAILNLPEAKGLERAAIAAALCGSCSLEVTRDLLAPYVLPPAPVTAAEVRARRAAFKLIESENKEDCHALETS